MELNEDILQKIDEVDVSEPAAMDMLFARLQEIEEENEEYMELLMERLKDETITWNQPWYQRNNCLTRPLTIDEEDDEECKRETFRTDSFSKEEVMAVHKNWRKFIKKFHLPDKPICIARWRNKHNSKNPRAPIERARNFVISYLARGLERNLYQVYRHFLTEYGGPVKGYYSGLEDKILEICFHNCPEKAVVYLSALLSREPRNIYKRLHLKNKGKPETTKIKWSLPLATTFLQYLMEYTGSTFEELKNKKIDLDVWRKLEKRMELPYYKLQSFWYRKFHVVLFVKYDVKFSRLAKYLVKCLQTYPSYRVWTDIRWRDIKEKFPDGFTPAFLREVFYKQVRNSEQSNSTLLTDPLYEILDKTLQYLRTVKKEKDKRLKTLKLNSEGILEPIQYDKKMPKMHFNKVAISAYLVAFIYSKDLKS